MTISLNAGSPASDQLEDKKDLAPLTATPLGGPMQTRSRRIFTSDDERIVSGTWECEPGESAWDFADRGKVIHVLSGQGTWTVHETLRKVFVIYK